MAAEVQAAAAGLRLAREAGLAAVEQARVAIEGRQGSAPRHGELDASQPRSGGRRGAPPPDALAPAAALGILPPAQERVLVLSAADEIGAAPPHRLPAVGSVEALPGEG